MKERGLEGKHALVGGASKGIGRSTAMAFAQAGVQVTLMARSEALLKEVVNELPNPGKHAFLVVDFSDPSKYLDKLRQYVAKNPVDIILNNAGGPPGGPLLEADRDAFLKAFQMHVLTAHDIASLCVPHMKSKGYGRIINVISTSVKAPIPGLGVSNTIRGAMANWAKTLANELGGFGITVNNVLPGFTQTGRLDSIIERKAEKLGKSQQDMAQALKDKVPASRFAQPEETAAAIAFLASLNASYINGINLPVDGGRLPTL